MRKLFLTALIFVSGIAVAQKIKTSEEQIWTGYFNQTRLSDKWGFWAEAQFRTRQDLFEKASLTFVRLGGTYYVTDNTRLTLGYGYFENFPSELHEHRPWQQLQWTNRYAKLRMMQWIRLEERFRKNISDDYNFNYRARYNLLLNFPLSKKGFAPKTLSFVANNEVHINFGKEIVYNSFDQNRFFLGFNFHANAHDQLQFGYLNVFQQLPAGNQYRSIHALRIGYFHNLDLRPKEEAAK